MTAVEPSSGFSSDTQCSFELKFDEFERDEDLMHSAGDLFAASQSPTKVLRDFGDRTTEEEKRTHSRKRKMDKEGFVTPATPDIPKSSQQYGMPGHSDLTEPRVKESGYDLESEDPEDGFVVNQQPHQKQQQQKQDITNASDFNMSSSQEPVKKYECAADLFEDLAQETKMVIIQMAQNFRESEEYESLCLANVESLLIEAKTLEASLRHQKDLLQQRLFMISRRLNSDNE